MPISQVVVVTFEVEDLEGRKQLVLAKKFEDRAKQLRAERKKSRATLYKKQANKLYDKLETRTAQIFQGLRRISHTSYVGLTPDFVADLNISPQEIARLRNVPLTGKDAQRVNLNTLSFADLIKANFIQRDFSGPAGIELKLLTAETYQKDVKLGSFTLGSKQQSSAAIVTPQGDVTSVSAASIRKEVNEAAKLSRFAPLGANATEEQKVQYQQDLAYIRKNIRQIIKKSPNLRKNILQKSSVLSFTQQTPNGIRYTTFAIDPDKLSNYLKFSVTEDGVLKAYYPQQFMTKLTSEINKAYEQFGQDIVNQSKSTTALLQTFNIKDVSSTRVEFIPGSVKALEGSIYPYNKFAKEYAKYLKKNTSTLRTVPSSASVFGKSKPTKNSVITNAQITELVRRVTAAKMPYAGPVKGPPLSATRLTYRTGRFVNSIKVVLDFYKQTIRYSYLMRPYQVHEASARDPQKLIASSIREIVKRQFNTTFSITRDFRVR